MSLQDAPHELREIPLEQSAFKDDEVALVTLGNAMLARKLLSKSSAKPSIPRCTGIG